MIRGAGGTPGGILHFIFGIAMILGGLLLLGSNIMVTSGFGFGHYIYSFGAGYGISAGSLLILFVVGVGMLFFNGKSIAGWIVAIGSLGALIVGVIMNLHVGLRPMSLIDISLILILIAGGTGFFFKSLKPY